MSTIFATNSERGATDTLLDVRDLRVRFRTAEGLVTAVDGVSFDVKTSQTLGIVGESGSGKSVSTKALMKLLPANAIVGEKSQLRFRTQSGTVCDIAGLDPYGPESRRIRGGEIAMIFQEPMASCSPVYTVGNQIALTIMSPAILPKNWLPRHNFVEGVGTEPFSDISKPMIGIRHNHWKNANDSIACDPRHRVCLISSHLHDVRKLIAIACGDD